MLPKLHQKTNFAMLEIGHKKIYFSYATPIAFHDGTRLWVRQNAWGPTTGKHLNAIDGGDALARANRYDGETFERMLRTEFNL
jgi:hypothetical protein